jgi:hypothetical protein
MNTLFRLIAGLACLAFAHATPADTLHAMQGGGFYHHQSGWVFPFKEGKSTRTIVYFVDAGSWIIRIRSSVPATDKQIATALEKLVRGQRWDSLQPS